MGLIGDVIAADLLAVTKNFEDDLDDVLDVTLRVNAAGNGEADEVHLRVFAEHERADFDGADAAFQIELVGESDAGELGRRNMWEEGAGVEINGVTAGRLNNGDAFACNVVP